MFLIQENVAFNQLFLYIGHNQFLQANYEQMMKTKLPNLTFAHQQILRKPIKKLVKIDWNIQFSWLKHNVKPVENQQAFMNTHHNYVFIQILPYVFCLQSYSN